MNFSSKAVDYLIVTFWCIKIHSFSLPVITKVSKSGWRWEIPACSDLRCCFLWDFQRMLMSLPGDSPLKGNRNIYSQKHLHNIRLLLLIHCVNVIRLSPPPTTTTTSPSPCWQNVEMQWNETRKIFLKSYYFFFNNLYCFWADRRWYFMGLTTFGISSDTR